MSVEEVSAEEEYATVKEMAAALKVSTDTIYRWANLGEIPAHRFGRTWRFDLAEVKAARNAPPAPWTQSRRSLARKRVA